MMTKEKFNLFAASLLVLNSVEVRNTESALLAPKFRLSDRAEKLTDAVFDQPAERVYLIIFHGNSDWKQGGMELVKDVDAATGEVSFYIENYDPRTRHLVPENQNDFDRVRHGG